MNFKGYKRMKILPDYVKGLVAESEPQTLYYIKGIDCYGANWAVSRKGITQYFSDKASARLRIMSLDFYAKERYARFIVGEDFTKYKTDYDDGCLLTTSGYIRYELKEITIEIH